MSETRERLIHLFDPRVVELLPGWLQQGDTLGCVHVRRHLVVLAVRSDGYIERLPDRHVLVDLVHLVHVELSSTVFPACIVRFVGKLDLAGRVEDAVRLMPVFDS